MPGVSGVDLAKTLLRERPNMLVVVMSGYTEDTLNLSGLGSSAVLLAKPFTPRELQQKIAESLSEHRREHPST
jgi:DNA-binding response OmpR family regulator